MKIGFIGAGNMTSNIVKGMLATQRWGTNDIMLSDIDSDKLAKLQTDLTVKTTNNNQEIAQWADVLILAVKPQLIPLIIAEMKEIVRTKRPLVISIAASITLTTLEELFGDANLSIIRVMPNINVMVQMAMSAICANQAASAADTEKTLTIFNAIGKTELVEEAQFANFTAIAGCSPAFVYMFIDALARGAVKNGMAKDKATRVAAQAVLGSAQMVLSSNTSPWDLVDAVCSPGGTTIAGVAKLEDEKFISAIIQAVDATIEKDELLSNASKSIK
jgi:pyrroline-5-carboxylate reductase